MGYFDNNFESINIIFVYECKFYSNKTILLNNHNIKLMYLIYLHFIQFDISWNF